MDGVCGSTSIKGSGTTDAIHAARLLMEKHREKNKPVRMVFHDLEKAFDRVPHALIWASLRASTKHEQVLQVMEMRMLRWTLGLTRWDQVMNEDVRKTIGVTPITEKMREVRLRWYGHVVRSEGESVAKRAMRLNPEGKRPRGRPKKRWMDWIKEDMKLVNAAPEDQKEMESNLPKSGPRLATGQTLGKRD